MITPVIHVIDYSQVRTNVETCLELGIDHVFVIDHDSRNSQAHIAMIREKLKQEFPDLWVGLNFLFLPNELAMATAEICSADALWCDNAGLLKPGDEMIAQKLENMRIKRDMLYFGGVEFKYQKQPRSSDFEWLYQTAVKYIDVITTSGPGTGKEVEIEKLARIKTAVGKHPVAVASGINENNAKTISQYADYLMVASSITDSMTELISKEKLQRLIDKC